MLTIGDAVTSVISVSGLIDLFVERLPQAFRIMRPREFFFNDIHAYRCTGIYTATIIILIPFFFSFYPPVGGISSDITHSYTDTETQLIFHEQRQKD